MKTTMPTGKAEDLIRAFLTLGFEPGAPPRLPADIIEIDRAACRSMRCPACGHRGMNFTPLHRGREYAAVAGCARCRAGEPM